MGKTTRKNAERPNSDIDIVVSFVRGEEDLLYPLPSFYSIPDTIVHSLWETLSVRVGTLVCLKSVLKKVPAFKDIPKSLI